MTDDQRITHAIFRAVDAVNRGRTQSLRVEKSLKTPLMGPGAVLDSLGMINLIVAIEEEVEDAFGVAINIADAEARAQTNGPFATVGSLTAYIATLLNGNRHRDGHG